MACLEWNDRTERVGFNYGVYDNPIDLTAESFTVMRFTEWVNPESDRLEWLIRKDGCMHCADPGCLKACPAPGAIVQYSNGIVDFDHDKCIGCGYCIKGCPFNIPRISKVDQRPTSARCARIGSPSVRVRPVPDLSDACDRVRHQGGDDAARGRRLRTSSRVASRTPAFTIRRASAAPM